MFTSAQSMNDELTERYRVAFESWSTVSNLHHSLSQPQLMKIPDSYVSSDVRLMIVGQETGGWGRQEDPTTEQGRDELRNEYTDFDLALKTTWRTSPFWQAAYQIRDRLNPGGAENGFLWTNLIAVSEQLPSGRFGRPSSAVADAVCALGLVAAEIEIARPHVVVFFTGKSRDAVIRRAFPRVSFVDVAQDIVSLKGLPGAPVAYRTEHPHTLWRMKRQSVIDQIANLALQQMTSKTSSKGERAEVLT
jgi:hypothetical protein